MDVEYDYLSEFRNATAADNEAYNDDSAEIVDGHGGLLSWWWNKDFSFIHLCIGLAKLWLGDYAQVLSFITMTESSMNNTVPKLLIPILFPKEFSLAKLFCLNRTTGSTGAVSAYSLSPDEVQIRFLMKVGYSSFLRLFLLIILLFWSVFF
ncbi:unnamed protein product [Trichobilharzia regenti]|nr:unnamed protein product [Trichobilharzia regenti]